MRITNSMLVSNSLRNINNNMRRLNEASEQSTTQQKIQLPSDDPGTATRSLKYRNYVAAVEQYDVNVSAALDWLDTTEEALSADDSGLVAVIQRIREITVDAANGTNNEEDLADMAEEVAQLKEEVISIMNTSIGGRYVFAGYSTDEEPYATETVTVGSEELELTTYNGQYLNLTGPLSASISETDYQTYISSLSASQIYSEGADESINYNIGFGTQITVNVEGQDVIGQDSGSNLLATIDKLLLALDGETTYQTASISGSTVTLTSNDLEITDILDDIDTDLERVLAVTAELGARMNTATRVQSRLASNETTYTDLLSKNDDVDVAEATINYTSAQEVYEASLQVGAKVINKSLLDYLY